MWDFPGVEAYRRSGGAPSADQSLAPSDEHHETPRRRPWIAIVFYGVMIMIAVWLLATNTADPDEGNDPPVIIHDERG